MRSPTSSDPRRPQATAPSCSCTAAEPTRRTSPASSTCSIRSGALPARPPADRSSSPACPEITGTSSNGSAYPDPPTFAASYNLLGEWLEGFAEETGIPPERTVLGGFSQGTVMAYSLGLGTGPSAPGGHPGALRVHPHGRRLGARPRGDPQGPAGADLPRRRRPGDRGLLRPRRPRPARAGRASRSPTASPRAATGSTGRQSTPPASGSRARSRGARSEGLRRFDGDSGRPVLGRPKCRREAQPSGPRSKTSKSTPESLPV